MTVSRRFANLAKSVLKSMVKATAITWLPNNRGTVQQEIVASLSFRMGRRASPTIFQGVLVFSAAIFKVGTLASSMVSTTFIAHRRHWRYIAFKVSVVFV